MKKFASNYERLERLRRQKKLLAELVTSRRSRDLQLAREQTRMANAACLQLQDEMSHALNSDAAIATLNHSTTLLRQLISNRNALQESEQQAAIHLDRAVSQLRQAATDQKIVESLVQQQRLEHRVSQRYEQEIELFELSQQVSRREAGK